MSKNKLRILVFDDDWSHRRAAEMLLSGHEVVVVGTYDEAEKALSTDVDYRKVKAIKLHEGVVQPNRYLDNEENKADAKLISQWDAFQAKCNEIEERCRNKPDFDVVMTDLLVPASCNMLGDKGVRFVGQQMPLGSIIALLALSRGIRMVTVVTDTGHHDHPASAAFDAFNGVSVVCCDVRVLCVGGHESMVWVDENTFEEPTRDFLSSDEGKKKYPERQGIIQVKAWNKILARLLIEDK